MYGCIDRFEGDLAVIYLDDEDCVINLPKVILPPDLNEGDYLKIDISYDKEKTEAAFAEAQQLFNE